MTPPKIRIGHKRLAGNFNQVLAGGVAPSGTHSSFILSDDIPPGLDPLLRGADLLHSTNWHLMNIGSDQGHTDLINNEAGAGAAVGDGTYTGQLVNDPVFGTVWRCRHMPASLPWSGQATIQRAILLPQSYEDFWYSIAIKFDGNGQTLGAQPTEGGPYSNWFSAFGSAIPGGSTTYKNFFAFPNPNPWGNRMSLTIHNGGSFETQVGHLEPDVNGLAQGGTSNTVILPASASSNNLAFPKRTINISSGTGAGQSRVVQSYVGATREVTVSVPWDVIPDITSNVQILKIESLLPQGGAPIPPWGSQLSTRARPLSEPLHDSQGTKDWYHYVVNKSRVSDTEYIQRYGIKRLTINGSWSPWTHYAWKGWRIQNGLNFPYNLFNFTGNKSQSNDGPNEMYTQGAFLEINKAADPWGMASYGV